MQNFLNDQILDKLMEGFQLIDFNWRYVYVNQSVASHGKTEKNELIGKTMMEKYPGIEDTHMFKTLKKCMLGRIRANFENEFVFPDGTSEWFELRIEPVPLGIFVLSLDITARKNAELEAKALNENLESLVLMRTHQLNLRNKDLTDSIQYAQRIQQAKLPIKSELQKLLPDSFIFYKPKEIVSGDFYFFKKTDYALHIVCADCTGHGVPGALMTMIASEKLEKAIQVSDHPSTILSTLNREIKTALRQSDNNAIRDGMDLALCSYDHTNNSLQFAGANRPLWLIRKGSNEIQEIKATRKAIGGFTGNEQRFDATNIQLNAGDTFYIFSDGYADSFGGPSGKKLMVKKFKQLLLSIQNIAMFDQEKYLENFIEDWRGSSEQIDDILVMGIRVH